MEDHEREQRLWEMYLIDCRQLHVTPTLKGYLIWKEDEDYDS